MDAHLGSSSHVNTHGKSCLISNSTEILEIEKEEQAAAEKAVTKEKFQGEWTAPAPEFTATQPEVADWSEGLQVPSVPIQQFPTEDWSAQPTTGLQLPLLRPLNA